MDKLDVRIVREFMQGEPLLSVFPTLPTRPGLYPATRVLSKKLGVTENTVRERIKRLSEFLPGGTLAMNPRVSGERVNGLAFDVPLGVPKDSVLEEIQLLEDLVTMIDHVGPHVITVFHYRDEESMRKKADLVLRLAHCDRLAYTTDFFFPAPLFEPKLIDLQIVAAYQQGVLKSDREIAERLGVSARTVSRRFKNMMRSGVIFPILHLNIQGLRDSLYAHITVTYEPELRVAAEAKIPPILYDHLVYNGHFVKYSGFHVIVPSLAAARGLLEGVRRVKGVTSARMDFVEKRFELYDLYERKVRAQIQQLTLAARSSRHPH